MNRPASQTARRATLIAAIKNRRTQRVRAAQLAHGIYTEATHVHIAAAEVVAFYPDGAAVRITVSGSRTLSPDQGRAWQQARRSHEAAPHVPGTPGLNTHYEALVQACQRLIGGPHDDA